MKLFRLAMQLTLGSVLLLGGCMRTTYQDLEADRTAVPLLERDVRYQLSSYYFRDPPQCAAIVTEPSKAPKKVRRAVEAAVERHLATRLPKVIGSAETKRLERRLILDVANPADRRSFAKRARCDAILIIRLHAVTDEYFVLWSQRGIGVILEMRDVVKSRRLWIAHHETHRGDGGVPLSPFSLPLIAARAAMLNGDSEVYESIADDAVRRMMATLPDMRFGKTQP